MNYVVRKKVDKSGDKEVVRYYAASKVLQPEPVSNDELAKRLAFVRFLLGTNLYRMTCTENELPCFFSAFAASPSSLGTCTSMMLQ